MRSKCSHAHDDYLVLYSTPTLHLDCGVFLHGGRRSRLGLVQSHGARGAFDVFDGTRRLRMDYGCGGTGMNHWSNRFGR